MNRKASPDYHRLMANICDEVAAGFRRRAEAERNFVERERLAAKAAVEQQRAAFHRTRASELREVAGVAQVKR